MIAEDGAGVAAMSAPSAAAPDTAASPSSATGASGASGTGAGFELDLDVFTGPFDLLLTLVLREEVDLLELQLAEVVLAYLDHLHARGELDLHSATEFIVLIAALLELKSRLMLADEDEQAGDIEPQHAADELLGKMIDALRFRKAGMHLDELLESEHGVRFRCAPLPANLRRTLLAPPEGSEDPDVLGEAIGRLLRMPPAIDLEHVAVPRVPVAERLAHLRALLAGGPFSFDEAIDGADRMTVAVTVFALLELYKRGEADWEQAEPFGAIAIRPSGPGAEAAAHSRGPRTSAVADTRARARRRAAAGEELDEPAELEELAG